MFPAQILAAAYLNLVGSALRNLTVFSFVPDDHRFTVLIVGQVVAACGQCFIMFTPAKTAALWFPDSQRAMATTLTTMGEIKSLVLTVISVIAHFKKKSVV